MWIQSKYKTQHKGPTFLERNIGGEVKIRLALVALVRLFIAESNLMKPFYLPSTNMTRDQHAYRISVISRQVFAIHFISKKHLAKSIKWFLHGKASTVCVAGLVLGTDRENDWDFEDGNQDPTVATSCTNLLDHTLPPEHGWRHWVAFSLPMPSHPRPNHNPEERREVLHRPLTKIGFVSRQSQSKSQWMGTTRMTKLTFCSRTGTNYPMWADEDLSL